jgi:indole-3-glycerol phosphate synthase
LALDGVQLIGINNRNLQTFTVDLQTTADLFAQRRDQLTEAGITLVSESGIYELADLQRLQQAGARAVLVGESLVKQPDPQQAIAALYGEV